MEIPFVVLDVNPDVVQADQRGRGTILYGDVTNPRVLIQAGDYIGESARSRYL